MEWYRWPTRPAAQASLDFLNAHPALPVIGLNAATGEPQLNACPTAMWCAEVTECVDGWYGFPRVPEVRLDVMGISQEQRQAFLNGYVIGQGGVIEVFDPAWIPTPPGM